MFSSQSNVSKFHSLLILQICWLPQSFQEFKCGLSNVSAQAAISFNNTFPIHIDVCSATFHLHFHPSKVDFFWVDGYLRFRFQALSVWNNVSKTVISTGCNKRLPSKRTAGTWLNWLIFPWENGKHHLNQSSIFPWVLAFQPSILVTPV